MYNNLGYKYYALRYRRVALQLYYRNKVRELRLKALIPSQAELARRSGICRTTICALENNRTALSIHYAFRLRKVLGCYLDDLYEELK